MTRQSKLSWHFVYSSHGCAMPSIIGYVVDKLGKTCFIPTISRLYIERDSRGKQGTE